MEHRRDSSGSEEDRDYALLNYELLKFLRQTNLEETIIAGLNKFLLDGADINTQNKKGNTVLHLAAEKRYQQVIRHLLSVNGIRTDIKNRAGFTAVDIAKPGSLEHLSFNQSSGNTDVIINTNNMTQDGINVDKGLKKPLSANLRVDKDLRLSNETFDNLLIACDNSSRPRAEILQLEPFPASKIMALFALLVYRKKGNKNHADYEKSLDLPKGWVLLTTASNTGWWNGYFGAAFLNSDLQQVVIAHRGTIMGNIGSWYTNLIGVIRNKNTPRMNSAITFTAIICKASSEANSMNQRHFQLSLTGHSLGGWLAQVSAFTAKYLQKDCEHFVKLKNDQERFHAHTLVFDNPGCKAMITKLMEIADFRYDRSVVPDHLDITCHLSAPNRINGCNLHLGTLNRIVTNLSGINFWFRNTPFYNLKAHSMEEMLKTLEGSPTIVRAVNWPRSGSLGAGSEHKEFFGEAKPKNNYHPESKEGDFYSTVPFDSKMCDLQILSLEEQNLLETWLELLATKFNLHHLDKLAERFGFKQYDDLLPPFTIDKATNTLKCNDEKTLHKVIGHCKQLIRHFSEDVNKIIAMQKADVPTAVESTFQGQSQKYLNSLPKSQVDFRDSIDLKGFLTSPSKRIFFIQAEDAEFQVTKLLNIFTQIKNDNNNQTDPHLQNHLQKYLNDRCQTFLELRQLRELDKLVNIESILKSDTSFDNLLVIEYKFEGDFEIRNSNSEFLDLVFKKLQQTGDKKIVLISSHAIQMPERISTEHPVDEVNITDLTKDAQKRLLEKKSISLQGTKISLAELTGIHNLDNASSIVKINSLISSEKLKQFITATSTVLHLGRELPTLSDIEVAYTTPVNKVTSLQELRMHFSKLEENVSRRPYFVISGVSDSQASESGWKKVLDAGISKVEIRIPTYSEDGEQLFKKLARQFPDNVVNWLQSTDGQLRWQQIYDPGFYIQRHFTKRVFIDNTKISKFKNSKDLFVFQKFENKESLMQSLDIKNEKAFFKNTHTTLSKDEDDAFVKNNDGRNIHFFKVEERDIVWQRSVGSLEGLRDCLKHNEKQAVSEEQLCNGSSKLVILADEPGMGKSTSLTRVSSLIESSWIIRIDFKHFQQPIKKLPYDITIDKAVDFLLTESTSGDSTERNLLQYCLQTDTSMQIYLLFDGFDEIQEIIHSGEIIKKCAQEKAIRLLRFLKTNTKANILVTTRKYPSQVLENELLVFETRFKKVDVEQQKAFVVKFWRCHLPLQPEGERDDTLQECANSLHRKAAKILGEDSASFMGIPLQMRMMAEVSLAQDRLCVESDVYRDITLPFNSVFELYEIFINAKYDIYLKDKSGFSVGLNEVNRGWFERELTKKHRALAFRQLFPDLAKDFLGTLPTDEEIIELNRVGLIQSGGDGTVEFTHRTFAEYFMAELLVFWLSKPRGRHPKYPSTEEFFVFKLLLEADYKVCRQFVDDQLRKSSPALWNDQSQVAHLWRKKKKQFFNLNHQTALHVAVQENRDSILGYLLGSFKKSPSSDYTTFVTAHDLKGDTALALAAKNESIIKKLLMHVNYDSQKNIILSTVFKPLKNKESCPHVKFIIQFTLATKGCWKLEPSFVQKRWDLIESILGAAERGELPILQEALNKIEDPAELRLLLAASVDLKKEVKGATALHIAAKSTKSTQYDIVQYLQEKNADIDAIDANAMTPLLHAANLETVKFLISHGADFMHCDLYNMTALAWAAKNGHCDIVKHLYDLEPGLLNIPDSNQITPLEHAAKEGHKEVVEFLLKKGADINAQDKFGMSALSWAAKKKKLTVLKFLLEKKADINLRDRYDMSSLQIAIKACSCEEAKYLVDQGAEINSADWNGMTALQRATRAGQWDLVQHLLDHGADVMAPNSGICILHYAVKANKPDIVREMLIRGAYIGQLDETQRGNLNKMNILPLH